MLEANGDIDGASLILGIDAATITRYIKADPALRARWMPENHAALPPSAIITRPDDIGIQEADALAREEEKLQRGLGALKLTNRGQELAMACQNFQRANFGAVIQIVGGGITMSFIQVLEEIEKINKKLDKTDDVPAEMRYPVEMMLRQDRAELYNVLHKFGTKVDQTILVQAKIQHLGSKNNGSPGSRKPGFSEMKRAEAVTVT